MVVHIKVNEIVFVQEQQEKRLCAAYTTFIYHTWYSTIETGSIVLYSAEKPQELQHLYEHEMLKSSLMSIIIYELSLFPHVATTQNGCTHVS